MNNQNFLNTKSIWRYEIAVLKRSFIFFRFLMVLSIFSLSALKSFGQNRFEIDLVIDNDLFTFAEDEDRYYSSGIFVSVRKAVGSESALFQKLNRKKRLSSLIIGGRLSQWVFTPDILDFRDIFFQDRPFAGLAAVGVEMSLYTQQNIYLSINPDFGVVGPASGTSKIHTWWHKQLNLITPTSWQFQIENRIMANLNIELFKGFNLQSGKMDFIYESKYDFGTVFNNIRQGGILRLGQIRPLHLSGYKNAALGKVDAENPHKKPVEYYFFIGMAGEYVLGNYTIDGYHPFKEISMPDELINWVFIAQSGFNIHWQKLDLGWHFFFNTKENSRAVSHNWGRLRMTLRF
ncbi:MAG: lipid A deacylase LpxR family protein [Bacteroidota bacterium]